VLFQGKEEYVIRDHLVIDHFGQIYNETHAAYIPPAVGQERLLDGSMVDVTDELVDLRALDPRFIIDLKFASDDNFAGSVLYTSDICLLQKETAKKLVYAQDIFEKDGYRIKIYDAYRPFSIQKILFDIIKDPKFVADPAKASHHNRGAALDISLVHETDGELEFLTLIHTFSQDSSALAQRADPRIKEIFLYFVSVMEQAGFYNYEAEWWHFSDTDWQKYMVTDHDLSGAYIYDHIPTGE
jgi:D-alanyl-D-alanine dipeptidase